MPPPPPLDVVPEVLSLVSPPPLLMVPLTVMVIVSEAVAPRSSVTVSWMTIVSAAEGATTVGFDEVALRMVAVAAPLICNQLYDEMLPSLSLLPLPSRPTLALVATV